MKIISNHKIFFLILVLVCLFFNFNIVNALPFGTILYKTSANGKMYGYNDFEFSMIPGKVNAGSVGIYLGEKDNIPIVVEVSYNGIKIIPAKYFVDLDKGEKFIGAKMPNNFLNTDKAKQALLKNILYQVVNNEAYDFTWENQKGPSSGQWTSAGFVEKMYESAKLKTLSYHSKPDRMYDFTYYSINITPDGYDEETTINSHKDVFSRTKEFSKIHKLGQGNFWESFLVDQTKDFIRSVLSINNNLFKIITNANIFGRNHQNQKYFFFPYTQFIQPTLRNVKVDIVLSSHNKSKVVQSFSNDELGNKIIMAFLGRITKESTKEYFQHKIIKTIHLDKVKQAYDNINNKVINLSKGLDFFTGKSKPIDINKIIKGKVSSQKKIKATLGIINESIQYADAKIKESAEISDRNPVFKENPREKVEELVAQIDTTGQELKSEAIEVKTMGEVEQFEIIQPVEVVDSSLAEINQLVKDIEIIQSTEISIGDLNNEQVEEAVLIFNQGDVVVNEFLSNPESGETEFIELYNNTEQSINLAGWSIQDNTVKSTKIKAFVIQSKSWLLLEQAKDFAFYLNNKGDKIDLKYKNEIIDSVVYGDFENYDIKTNAPCPDKGASLARIEDGQDTNKHINDWKITTTTTPGLGNKIIEPEIEEQVEQEAIVSKQEANSQSSSSSSSNTATTYYYGGGPQYNSYEQYDVVISEIAWMGTQSDYNDEWIELYNNTNKTVDISGWTLIADDNSPSILLDGEITTNEYFILERTDDNVLSNIKADKIYSGALNNSGEKLLLKDGNANIIDEVDFSNIWPEGNNETKATMERTNLISSGNIDINWQTHTGQGLFATDSDGHDIIGSPGREKSIPPVDQSPPEIEITHSPNSITTNQIAIFEFSTNEEVVFSCKINNNDWEECVSPKQYDNLLQGTNLFYIKAIDENDNQSQSFYSWVIDFTAPIQVENLNVIENNPLQLILSWDEVSDVITGIDYYEINFSETTTSTTSAIFTFNADNRTDYSFKVRAIDSAGNSGTWSEQAEYSTDLSSLKISEVQIADNEFVELFNPTDSDINLDNWFWAYYSSGQDWGETPFRLKQFPDGTVIESNNYFLIGVYNFSEQSVDWQLKTDANQPYASGQLSNSVGSIVIYSSDPSNKTAEQLQQQYIDVISWGSPDNVFEGSAFESIPLSNQSIERKPGYPAGNTQDQDNNSQDFIIQITPNPQNSNGRWLNGWDNRDLLVIDNKLNSNDLTDWQVKIEVDYQDGMQADFSDIKFTSLDGITILSYFREEYIDNASAIFWIKLASIPKYSEVIIYQYYNNASATYNGNGEDVFVWFDDFSTDRSDEYDSSSVSWVVNDGNSEIRGFPNGQGYLSPLGLEMKNLYVKTRMMLVEMVQTRKKAKMAYINYRQSDENNYWQFGMDNRSEGLVFEKIIDSKNNVLSENSTPMHTYDEWAIYEAWAYEANHRLHYQDDNYETTWTTTTNYLNQAGEIHIKGAEIDSDVQVKIDYLMIGKHTQPELQISNEAEGYEVVSGIARDSYPEFLNWDNRSTITIGNSTSTADLIDYAVQVEVDFQDGMQADFSDIRFTNSDKSSGLKYWNESYVDSASAIFWVKVPLIPASGSKSIYMYYNNASATYNGNGEDVFVWFDDFSTDRSSEYDSNIATWVVSDGQLKIRGVWNEEGYITPTGLQMQDLYVKTKMMLTSNYNTNKHAKNGVVEYRSGGLDANSIRFGIDWNAGAEHGPYGANFREVMDGDINFELYQDPGNYENRNDWVVLESWAYETSCKFHFVRQDNLDLILNLNTEDVNTSGNIYLRGDDIAADEAAFFDYLIIGKYKQPELTIDIEN
ncbi:MAG: DUF2341 domain-containing protein [Candidatus Portnoybacteria bacterium]|nr:DUF2341 domain-containing protein [Candidatus Portnoybacteria bacterium]